MLYLAATTSEKVALPGRLSLHVFSLLVYPTLLQTHTRFRSFLARHLAALYPATLSDHQVPLLASFIVRATNLVRQRHGWTNQLWSRTFIIDACQPAFKKPCRAGCIQPHWHAMHYHNMPDVGAISEKDYFNKMEALQASHSANFTAHLRNSRFQQSSRGSSESFSTSM